MAVDCLLVFSLAAVQVTCAAQFLFHQTAAMGAAPGVLFAGDLPGVPVQVVFFGHPVDVISGYLKA